MEAATNANADTAADTDTTNNIANGDNKNNTTGEGHHRGNGGSSGRGRGRGRGRHAGRGRGKSNRHASPQQHGQQENREGNKLAPKETPSVNKGSNGESATNVKNQYDAVTTTTTTVTTGIATSTTNGTVTFPSQDNGTLTPATKLLNSTQVVQGHAGGPMILMRSSNTVTDHGMAQGQEAIAAAVAAVEVNASIKNAANKKKGKDKKKKTPRKDKKKIKKTSKTPADGEEHDDYSYDDEDDEEEDVDKKQTREPQKTAVQALKALPAQEVSITASTKVQIVTRDGSPSAALSKLGEPIDGSSAHGSATNSKKSKKPKGRKNDTVTKAARRFNNDVRICVEQSDPETMRALLRNKKNHKFALEAMVLETVMKAYVMAAMFDDALYCLRNCSMPGTMSTLQAERILTCLPQNLRNSSAYTAADMINALCLATEFDTPTTRTYFMRIVRGISLEFLEEATSARDRICSAPCERLVRSGTCVVDARLKRGKKATELVVIPGEQLGVFVPDTTENRGIQAGDAVSILPYAGPYPMSAESLDRNMIEATVVNTNPMVIRLQDKANAALHSMLTETVEGNVYRIDKLANRMGFNRQLSAAVAIASPLSTDLTRDPRRPCPELIKAITAMDESIDQVMKQRGGFQSGQLTSTAALCAEAIPWDYQDENENLTQDEIRQTSALALEKYNALEGLNASQRLAVEGASCNRLTLIQGPPGTGKTAVAIRILQHWARLAKSSQDESQSPILATSDSNIAVDNLVEGCAAVGLSVVRLGRPEAIRPELLRYCIDRPPSSYSNNGNSYNSSAGYKERLKTLKNAQVICCTCIGSGGDILDSMTFDRVLVDEATQATEPAVLVPLMRGCRQLVLVGDHCQLPPTVLSTRGLEEGQGVPLFSRMVACGVPPFMLDTQYRMHPCIAMFPSDLFYGGKLLNGVSSPERRPLAGFPWPREEFPVAYIPVKGVEMDDGVSKYNELEAEAACRAVQALLEGGQCTVSNLAVVTPYAAEARLIRRMTKRLVGVSGPPYIEVSSVDGFQGREKEAVVFSAVRCNDYGAIGFTSDWRRVNVSFTRARRALIVIGDDVTLRRGDPDTWGPWLAWADAHGINMDKPGIPRGRYDPEQLRRVRGGTTAAEMLKDVLERRQAQLKSAEQQLNKADTKFNGREQDTFNGGGGGSSSGMNNNTTEAAVDNTVTLEQEMARLENTDGNWDDSDDEEHGELKHSVSKITLTSGASSGDLQTENSGDSSAPADPWDL